MRILVGRVPIVVGSLGLSGFRECFCKSFDLKQSVYKNLEITSCCLEDKKLAKKYIWYGVDWGKLLAMFNEVRQDIMDIKIYSCTISGYRQYVPSTVDKTKGEFVFEEKDHAERVDFLVIDTFNPTLEKHMEYMLGQNLVNWANKQWKTKIDL